VEHNTFRHRDTVVPVTISLGVAYYIDGESPEQLIARADKALYEAKNAGRNRVCVAA
jgi:diguanylate cyclase (GGDEF)-like protein